MFGKGVGVLGHLVGELSDGVGGAGVGDEEVVDLVVRVVEDEGVLLPSLNTKKFGGEGELVGDGGDAEGVGINAVGGVILFG